MVPWVSVLTNHLHAWLWTLTLNKLWDPTVKQPPNCSPVSSVLQTYRVSWDRIPTERSEKGLMPVPWPWELQTPAGASPHPHPQNDIVTTVLAVVSGPAAYHCESLPRLPQSLLFSSTSASICLSSWYFSSRYSPIYRQSINKTLDFLKLKWTNSLIQQRFECLYIPGTNSRHWGLNNTCEQ